MNDKKNGLIQKKIEKIPKEKKTPESNKKFEMVEEMLSHILPNKTTI